MPVMEGKAVLFKAFAGVDAFPICLNTNDVDKFVEAVKLLEPTFGGINLEDIAAPNCFLIEQRLKEEMDIPVFHVDQHGTAIVTASALLNALKVTEKKLGEVKVVVNGAGSAGIAIIKFLLNMEFRMPFFAIQKV
jgi:malate dehydrogenase (oxaloacetate-decarboxylating)